SAKSPRRESITCFTPSVLSRERLLGLPAVAITSAPRWSAIWMAAIPTPRARVNKDALALAQSRHVSQRIPGGHENDRQCCCRLKCQICRHPSHVSRTRYRMGGNSKDGESEHTISWRKVHDVRAHRFNDAADFVAKNARIRSVAW